jgi:hypothetical protein
MEKTMLIIGLGGIGSITPNSVAQSPGGQRWRYELFRESLRRFAAGEMLLNVVDKRVGY